MIIHFKARFLKKLGLLTLLNLRETLKINGKNFYIPIIEGVGFTNLYLKEGWMVDLLTKFLPQIDGDILDIGSNLGQTILKIKSVDETRNVYAFEPNPTCVNYLYKLIRANNFQHIDVFPCAAGNTNGILKLNMYNEDVDESATIIENFRTQDITRSVHIASLNLDSLLLEIEAKPGLIKIDVEGAELDVLLALKEVITEYRPVIICEILPVYDEKKNPERLHRQNKIQSFLSELNYNIIQNTSDGYHLIPSFDVHSDMDLSNYIFIPDERKNLVESFR